MKSDRPDWVQKIKDSEKKFWRLEYPTKSKEEKIKHWASSLHRSMRSQEEIGQDAYSLFSEDWLKAVLEIEPGFLTFLQDIFKIWSGIWDSNKIERILLSQEKKLRKE